MEEEQRQLLDGLAAAEVIRLLFEAEMSTSSYCRKDSDSWEPGWIADWMRML